MKIQSAKDLENIGSNYRQQLYYPEGIKVNIGMSSCVIAAVAQDIFQKAVEEIGPDNGISICQNG